jgi:hypothetical protein
MQLDHLSYTPTHSALSHARIDRPHAQWMQRTGARVLEKGGLLQGGF